MVGTAQGLRSRGAGRALFAVIATVVFMLDRVTKGLVVANIPLGTEVNAVPGLVWLTNTRNSGAAFGMARSGSVLFLVASVVVAAVILWCVFRTEVGTGTFALLGLIFGGTVGNGYDRLFHGLQVTDFIDVHWWPIFNVADSAISTGVALLLLGYLLRQRAAG